MATYKVKAGDTLSKIAESYNVDMWELADANGIRNPNVIRVGQILTLPAEKGVKYADIGRAFMKTLAKLELLDEFKELSGLLDE